MEIRYAATKPTASNLTTHGKVWCPHQPSQCKSDETLNDPLLKNHYIWAFTTTSVTLSTALVLVNESIARAREGRGR